jgi:poly-gamma-glutamate synthase PgsB/CapB
LSGGLLVILVLYFLWEHLLIKKKIQSIPLRICVTGTRGKSSVARLITSLLKEAGFTVLARTTGSKPVITFPDGEEQEILRKGSPSILEGKRVLKLGAELNVNALVTELMSIHPECSSVESGRMFYPHIMVITNVRLDHLSQMGSTRQEIARCFTSAFPDNGTVFVPQEEFFPVFQKAADDMNARVVQVSRDSHLKYLKQEDRMLPSEFEENIRLVLAVAEFLNIDKDAVLRSLKRVKPDFGSFKIWTKDVGTQLQHWYLLSCFAANDPDSTRRILSRLVEKDFLRGKEVVGLLNLRRDRGDRTVQWLESFNKNTFPEFRRIFLIGEHAHAFKKRLKRSAEMDAFILKSQAPQKIMEEVSKDTKGEAVCVGMGNMGGAGRELVEFWENTGRSHDL